MILDALGCFLSIFMNIDFHDFDPHDVIHVTWRRVLRTLLPLPEGVPQVKSSDDASRNVCGLLEILWNVLESSWMICDDFGDD